MACILRFAVVLLLLGLSGCAGTYRAYISMYEVALNSQQNVVLPYSFIANANYDYLYVRRGDSPQVAMGLMHIEQGQFKWISGDYNMLMTRNGRIVRTLGLDNDLLFLTNQVSDPLQRPLLINAQSSWLRLADWQQGEYGYQIRSQFTLELGQTLSFFGHELPVIKLTETLVYENDANFVRFDDRWQNTFWLDAKTGRMLKASQQLQPAAERFELVFISEVVRRIAAAGLNVAPEAI